MKKIVFVKALIGIPLGIFVLELLNIIISLNYGSYIRMECLENGINLNSILNSYLYCTISSYLLGIATFHSVEIMKKDVSPSQKRKENNKVLIPIIIIIFTLYFIVINKKRDSYVFFGFIPSFIWSGIAMVTYGLKNIIDRYSIREINKKIKETINKQ